MTAVRWTLLLVLATTAACAVGCSRATALLASPVATATRLPDFTATPAPSLDPIPSLTPTPAPVLRRLTSGGCCVQPFWSPDGSQVWFIDRPNVTSPSGIWGVDALGEAGRPQFLTDRLGVYSTDGRLVAYPEAGQTYVERVGGTRWVVPSQGRAISFSPDGRRIAWQIASSPENLDRRVIEVWVAEVDGSAAHRAAQLVGGGVSGWFPDGERLLVSGRVSFDTDPFLAVLNLADESLMPIVRGARLRGGLLSPAGGWVAYQITFSGDPAQDGLWVVRADGTGGRRLDVFGAYRWRSEGQLLVIPLEAGGGAISHRLLEVDAAGGRARALTDPSLTPFRIAGGDWSVSPDGNRVAFVSASDHNLWVIDLPPP